MRSPVAPQSRGDHEHAEEDVAVAGELRQEDQRDGDSE